MGTAEEIESAVSTLPPAELSRFRSWFQQFDAEAWDRQREEDAAAECQPLPKHICRGPETHD